MDNGQLTLRHPAIAAAARRCRALGDPIRLRIALLLREHDCTVGEVADAIGLSYANASRHLGILADCDIIERRRIGAFVICTLESQAIAVIDAVIAESGRPQLPTPHGLGNADPDDVRLTLQMAAALLRRGAHGRTEWDLRMIDMFGRSIAPQLDLLRTAALRIARGHTLDGLPLPPAILAEGVALFERFAARPGTTLPDE